MGGSQGMLIEWFATRGFPTVETRPIPGGHTDLCGRRFACGRRFLRLESRDLGGRCGSGLLVCVGDRGKWQGLLLEATSCETPQQCHTDDASPRQRPVNERHRGFLLGYWYSGGKTHAMPLVSG
jgi:hypothetical protein